MGMSEQDDIRALIARIEMDACPGFGDLATQCCKSLDALKAMLARDERAARENEGGEAVGWDPKPNKPGRYAVRGFDSSGTEALVCVAYDDDQLVCNLHDSNSDPLRKFSNLMSEISNKFEWAELYSAPLTEDADDLPIVWIDPENIRRTMIASPGETVEVSAYREGEFTAPLYTHPPQAQGVSEGWSPEWPPSKDSISLIKMCELLNGMMDGTEPKKYGLLEPWKSTYERLAERLTTLPKVQRVPEGYVLAPKSMCITQEDVGLIVMMTGWDDEDQDDAEGVLWFGLIEDDEGNRTHGLNISCSECMEEGAIQLVQFDEPNSTPAAPQAVEIEPDLFWDYDNGEDSGQDSAYELASYCAQDMPANDTMLVDVMCAKRLPNRQMLIWIDDDDDVQWEWISPQPPEQGDE